MSRFADKRVGQRNPYWKGTGAVAGKLTPDELSRRRAEFREKALANFSFPRVGVPGQHALAQWKELKSAGRGVPVVIGDKRSFDQLLELFGPIQPNQRTLEEILAAAGGIRHPQDLAAQSLRELERSREFIRSHFENQPNAPVPKMFVPGSEGQRELTREETIAAMLELEQSPPVGDWPSQIPLSPELSVAQDRNGPAKEVYIVLIPTDDWTTIPAHLRWGGWNSCPAPEYHVAALRSWRDRFGAELIGLAADTMNLKVARRPQNRAEALELAREQYQYCNDIVDQGVGSLSALAASLMASDWWFFWWD
jgi:hypothetical protein